MPRGRNYRRSQAARKRAEGRRRQAAVELLPPCPDFVPRCGTGTRSPVKQYPISVSGKTLKLVIPAESANKKFVLIIGDSHLRAIADGTVGISKGNLSFGVMSTPGASASHLRTELLNATLPRTPDAVCILAPGNNLTTSSTHDVAGEEFRELLISARDRWDNVFVLDFVPRLSVAPELQKLISQEFQSVAKSMDIPYYSTFEHFPLGQLDLWFKDSVHLSDEKGMGVLVKLLQDAAYNQLEVQQDSPRTSPSGRRSMVMEEVFVPPPPSDPYVWMERVNGKKRIQSEEQPSSAPKRRLVQHQVDGSPVVLKECFIPLNPVWFSSSMLAAMDAVVPSLLPSPDCPTVPQDKEKPVVEQGLKPVACKRRHAMHQVKATLGVVEVSPGSTFATVVEVVANEVDETPSVVCLPKMKTNPTSGCVVEEVSAIEDVTEQQNNTLTFNPLCPKVAKRLCTKFNVDLELQDVHRSAVSGSLGHVCETDKIKEDGNGFFRAVAQVISGSQKSHRKIRLAAVKYMQIQCNEKMQLAVKDYIQESKMNFVGICATKKEIQATANAFGVDIFTYSDGKWLKYSCKAKLSNGGIYLKHCENNHFEPVVCVQQVNEQVCFQLCKRSETRYHLRDPKVQEQSPMDTTSTMKKTNCLSKYMKNKRRFQSMFRYHNNVLYREKVKERNRRYQERGLDKLK
ncbi:uncharacterized protein LOC127365008 [Dicentrarchus labrax]|uniref:ubiquitinyl hydrolase 1 n=1 Tax=Dicentrarchus labrax TaxID=13489 RepID=A0A8C4IV73_DICLA|nr:uncharacterized protein LOC127365008 [Dicentrarchus labrax]